MQTVFSTGCALRRCRQWLTVTILATLVLAASPVLAVEVEALYDASVPLDPDQPDSRDSAYERALQQVLVRITGSEDAAFSPELRALFPNPARFVLQYRPGENNSLWVSLDGQAIEQVLKGSNQPVWGSDRPLTVLWIAVDWGQGRRELLTAAADEAGSAPAGLPNREQALRQRLMTVAQARGVPVRLPPNGAESRAGVSASDIWGGFHNRIMQASREYGANSVLIGRLRPMDGERNRWTYFFGNQERNWNGDPEDAVHLLADTLASEFAFAGNAPAEAVALTVSNVSSVTDYAALQSLLGALEMVDSFAIDTVSGDRIRYRVRLNGGAQRLASVLDFHRELERRDDSSFIDRSGEEPVLRPGGESLSYRYQP